MRNKAHNHPVAVYHTTISILLHMVLYVAIIAMFTYCLMKVDYLGAQLLFGTLIAAMILPIVHILRHTHDRIIVTSSHLSLTNVEARSKQEKWKTVKKAILPWSNIKDISPDYEIKITKSVIIQKQVIVTLRNNTKYYIDSDLYDVFFLENKLKAHWHRFSNQK